MINKKRCENCGWYQGLDDMGICEREDGRVNPDPGFSCKFWKGIKYNRTKFKQETDFEYKLFNEEGDQHGTRND